MLNEISLEEFKTSGMLWFVNNILHVFGIVLVMELDEEKKIVRMYPARTKFRGFSEDCNTRGYKNISKYMVDNADVLLSECEE